MALLDGIEFDMATEPYSASLLNSFDFDATLDSNDPSLLDGRELPSDLLSISEQIEEASKEGDLPAVQDAFARLRSLLPQQHTLYTGRSLSFAIDCNHQDIVAYLLSEGVQVSSHLVKQATLLKNKAILQLLFEHGWNINDELGWSDPPALAYAVEDIDLTTWFLSQGADPNAACFLDRTPLSAAVHYAPFSVIELLFQHGGSIEHGQLLHAAIWREMPDRKAVVGYILDKGAPADAVMYHNKPEAYLMREAFGPGTPLHDAAALGDEDVLRLLVSRGARLDARDSLGFLPSERAEANGHSAAARYLRDKI